MTNTQREAIRSGYYDSSERSCLGECVKCLGWRVREYKIVEPVYRMEEENFQLCDKCLIEILGEENYVNG